MKALFVLVFCASIRAQQGSVEGITVDAITKTPVAGVHVRLITGNSAVMTASYGAISDREGRFSIATIRPGTYILFPERSGYLYAQSRAESSIPNIVIHPGERQTGMKIEMAPRAILSGKVVDEFGDPVQGVTVEAIAVSAKEGLMIVLNPPSMPSDDRGGFRVATVEGRYYLQASPAGNTSQDNNERPEVRTDGTSGASFNTTFYPSSIVKERATPVDAAGGKEVSGLEIRLSRQKGLSIGGTVSGIPDGSWCSVVVQWGKSAGQTSSSTGMTTDFDGKFRVANAQPGFYRVWAMTSGKPRMASRIAEFQLDFADVNVDLALAPAAEVSGTLEFEGDPPGALAEKRTVRLEPTAGAFHPLPPTGGDTDARGSFRVEGVGVGKFRVSVEPLPENAYVKKVEIDGTVVDGAIVDLKSGARFPRVKVTLSRNGGQLTGRVVDEDGQRLFTTLVLVMLSPVPVPEPIGGEMLGEVQPDGRYSFKSVRPGKYRVLAVEMLRTAGYSQAAQLKLLEKAEEIEIKAGDRIEKEIRLLPKEDANGKAKE